MAQNSNIHNLLYAFDLYRGMQENRLEYIYRGPFTDKIIEKLMLLAESNLKEEPTTLSTKKKLYFLMVESLQNISRHQHISTEEETTEHGLFIIRKAQKRYVITTGNLIGKTEVEKLRFQIDKINALSADELKDQYRKTLDKGEISSKGGAGLGLIGMARKSGNKLEYSFREVDEESCYFYLNLSLDDHECTDYFESCVADNYFENISNIHGMLNMENVLLNYCGSFLSESYKNLEEIIRLQIKNEEVAERLHIIVHELVQNIYLFGANPETDEEKASGIFIYGMHENHYQIATGNFIRNSKIDYFEEEIEKSCQIFNIVSTKTEAATPVVHNLSFMKIQLASNNCLSWEIQSISEDFSFITIVAEMKVNEIE